MSELDSFEKDIVANVEKYGCQVMHVFDPDGLHEAFSYSIGFPFSVSQPEVITFGLPSKLMHSMINEVCKQCEDGLILQNGMRISGLLEGHECELRAVHADQIAADHFGSAMWYHRYRSASVMSEAYQIVWPGAASGLFPWDEGASEDVIDAQPALYEVAA